MYNPPETLRQISSRLTFVTKFVSPVVGVIVAVNMFGVLFRTNMDLPWIGVFLAFVVAITAYNLWVAYRIKAVKADSNNLYVSNYFKETRIPMSHIAKVTEFRMVEPRIVTIHLNTPSELGQRIAFQATYRFWSYSPHPIVNELQQMAGFKTYNEVKDGWLN